MIERYITISSFRSIGDNKKEVFELNYLMDKDGSYGGLVTLIGENNSGKSNFLDALKAFQNRKFSNNDRPFNEFDPKIQPSVSFVLHDKSTKKKIETKLIDNTIRYTKKINRKEIKIEPSLNVEADTEKFLQYLVSDEHINQTNQNPNRRNFYNVYSPIAKKIMTGNIISSNEYSNFRNHLLHAYIRPLLITKFNDTKIIQFLDEIRDSFVKLTQEQVNQKIVDEVQNDFKVKALPNIITYVDNQKINNAQTLCNVSNGKTPNTEFFIKLFDLLEGEELSSLQLAYQQFHASGRQRKSILTNYERKLNKSINKLSNLFNKIYTFNGNDKYTFRMVLESDNVYFMIADNGEDIHLDSQSTGFRWFFDFFFNVFANKQIQNGDIVLLDEPATNLHVAGQIELRKQIKKFGMLNGITFVMSTHSPFLIDPDYFDELRVVSKVDHHSSICNKFTVTQDSNVDVMMPIKTALTVNRHILLNPKDILIFVEGITDYNYLVGFKELLEVPHIRFMPIQGIKRANLYKELLKITQTPILLVDSDDVGKDVYEKNKNKPGIEIYKLSDIDAKWKEIEDVFAATDRKRFRVDEKDYKVSSGFKNALVNKRIRVSKETKDNFDKLLKHINA